MRTNTKKRILELCTSSGMRPKELVDTLNISNAAVHRNLRSLEAQGLIEKRGKPPKVVYVATKISAAPPSIQFDRQIRERIDKNFCYFLPNGKELSGTKGFLSFLTKTKQDKDPKARANEYLSIVEKAESFRDKTKLIKGTSKLKGTFSDLALTNIYYSDFYSLPKYGKTKLGQYILHGKSGQNKKLISTIAELTKTHVEKIVATHAIEALCFIPHSIPRKISFLKEYKRYIALQLPEITLIKAYAGDVTIAQKSLSKLSERIENARDTIFVSEQNIPYKKILIIDDALGSGATMNEVAKKLFSRTSATIYGYAIVGSYKGFEVIKEI